MNATDRRDIELFLRNVEDLMASRLFEKRQIMETSLRFDAAAELMSITSTTPDGQDTLAMLTVLRKFTMAGGGSSLRHIFNVCERELGSDSRRKEVRDLRRDWKEQGKGGPIQIIVHDSTYAPEELFDCILNGRLFHDDAAKLERLRTLVGPTGRIALHSFMGYIFGTVGVITKVARVIRGAVADGSLR